ncbi:MAG: class I SAM-dependent methyltransferase [Candidatus Accumulibacter sp.]|jgi:16S rRNA (guanine1516-N2)-methyltransferase|nr:class I SAM-dependent methyltransferase [Accumulibacter sp.]
MSSEAAEEFSGARAPTIRVEAASPEYSARAAELVESLKLPLAGEGEVEAQFALQVGEKGLQLVALLSDDARASPVRADFVSGGAGYRRRHGGGARQMIAKAAGLAPGIRPSVLDATAGLGRDAFVLASLGCAVTLVERQAIVAALLEDGLERARENAEAAPIVARMRFLRGDALPLMRAWRGTPPQVVYLDPMFPPRVKVARVKKEMRFFRPLADDGDVSVLLEAALALASHRVVVKRPRKAPPIDGVPPKYAVEGRSSRFDVYTIRSLSKAA